MRQITKQKRVWVDTDITIGHKSGFFNYCDVDDGYALTALLRSVEVDVIGVSSTLGNTDDIEVSTAIARKFIANYGPNSVQVYKGAATKLPANISQADTSEAVEKLAEVLEEERITIFSVGAATNIATLLLKYPKLGKQIEEVVLVAGRTSINEHFISGPRQFRPFRDLNFEFDPNAFDVLLKSNVPLTLVPFRACHQVWIEPGDLIKIGESNKVGRFLAEHSIGWITEWEVGFGTHGFNPFDLVAAGYVIAPESFTSHQWRAVIETGPDDTAPGRTKPYLICNETNADGRIVNFCMDVDKACKPYLMERICSHDMSAFVLGLSHINVIVPDVAEATEFYGRVLGFEEAYDENGEKMDYTNVTMEAFALDAGLMDGNVNVDVRFLRHPQTGIYLELMTYHAPKGNQAIPGQPKTYDMGGPRHIAMEVSNCHEVFHYLKDQEGVTMINPSDRYHPVKLEGFPITFFYWIDKYGIQWEMEEGRRIGISRGIV